MRTVVMVGILLLFLWLTSAHPLDNVNGYIIFGFIWAMLCDIVDILHSMAKAERLHD